MKIYFYYYRKLQSEQNIANLAPNHSGFIIFFIKIYVFVQKILSNLRFL